MGAWATINRVAVWNIVPERAWQVAPETSNIDFP